jgi:hypothetical protein
MPLQTARILLFITVLHLAACGGGSSSEVRQPTPADTLNISGIVVDGPIAGARVEIRNSEDNSIAASCGIGGRSRCETLTDEKGLFFLHLGSSADLSSLRFVATGGQDTHTGVDFSEISLTADFDQFDDPEERIAITPITTLFSHRRRIAPQEDTDSWIRSQLALPDGLNLADLPEVHPTLAERSMILTAIAKETAGEKDGFAAMAKIPALFNADGTLRGEALPQENLGLEPETLAHIKALEDALSKASPEQWGDVFQHRELQRSLVEELRSMLQDDSLDPSDFENPLFLKNIDRLVTDIRGACAPQLISLTDLTLQRIARYVFFSYGLLGMEDFLQSEESFRQRLERSRGDELISLVEDPEIIGLANSRARHQTSVPLRQSQLLDTEARRIEYYVNSDASRFYQAERLIAGVGDAVLNDEIMSSLANGKARFGLFEDARAIADTQIVQPEVRGKTYLSLARRMIEKGREADAFLVLNLAEQEFLRIIETKGIAFIENSDTQNLQQLAANYRKIEAEEEAWNILDLLEQAVPHLNTTTLFGRLIVGTWEIADQYLEREQFDEARPMVDSLLSLAMRCPPNDTNGHLFYKARVFYLTETAKRYAELGDVTQVEEIYQIINDLRENDGLQNLTRNETWFYMISLVETLYSLGLNQQAMDLALSIPDSYENYRGFTMSGAFYRASAMKAVTASIALENGIDAAGQFMAENLTDPHDQIEAWTYMAGNKQRAYTAQQAIEQQFFDLAQQALLRARGLVAQLEETTERNHYRYAIQYGYVKLADLAWEAQAPVLAQELIDQALAAAEQLNEAQYRVTALIDIAEIQRLVGQPEAADLSLQNALQFTLGNPGEDAIDLQELILEAFSDFAENTLTTYIDTARGLFTQGQNYTGTEHDDLAELEARSLIYAANLISRFTGTDAAMRPWALELLDEAREVAELIYVSATRISVYISDDERKDHLIDGYAQARDFDTAIEMARSLPYRGERNLALKTLASLYSEWDDLPHTDLASVDTDGDGRPNFFNPNADPEAAAAQGLELDPDSDGDGIPDEEDYRPLYYDEGRR